MTKEPPSQADKDRIRGMVDRMMQAYDVDKKNLSEILNCQIGTVNNWVHFARTPYDQLVQCRNETGANLDWLMFGGKASKPTLSKDDVREILHIVQGTIDGALAYETMMYCYPEAGEKLSKKLRKDLEAWNVIKAKPKPDPNGDDND